MVDYAAAYSVWLLIEGVGPHLSDAQATTLSNDDRFRFTNAVPAFAALHPSGVWQAVLVTMPDVLSERLQRLGGVAELGGLGVEILDYENVLSTNIAPEVRPVTRLTADVNDVGSPTVLSIAGLSATDVLYIGDEAITLTASPAGTTLLNRRRAALGTINRPHKAGDPVYLKSPFIGGRRVDVYLAPTTATASSEAVLTGSYEVEGLTIDASTNVWTLTGKSFQRGMGVPAPAAPRSFRIVGVPQSITDGFTGTLTTAPSDEPLPENQHVLDSTTFARIFVQVNDEILGGYMTDSGDFVVLFRGVAGTKVDDIEPGDIARQVLVASDVGSSFRVDNVATQHPLECLLNVLLSQSSEDDGLPASNVAAGEAAYDYAPTSYGGSVPADNIDWASWREVIDRTRDFTLPNLVYGLDDTTIGEWADEQILKPLGAHLVFQNDKIYCVRPRLPLVGEEVETITFTDIHASGTGEMLPEWSITRDLASAPSTFEFEIGPGEIKTAAVAKRSGISRDTESIAVPGARSTDNTFWVGEATARVLQLYKPRTKLSVSLNARTLPRLLGDVVRLTVAELPNLSGGRGVNSLAQIVEREVRPSVDQPLTIQTVLDVYSSTQTQRRIAPSARVVSVSGGQTANAQLNRFTRSSIDSPTDDLPDRDALAFSNGDVVQLRSAAGVLLGGGATETVTFVSAGVITLTGNFGGALAAGTIITTADYDDCSAAQRARYAFMAGDDFRVDASDAEPSVYGDE